MCSLCSGARRRSRRLLVELHGNGRQSIRGFPVGHLADVPVRHHLGIVEDLDDGLHRGPRGIELREQGLPLVVRALGELLVEDGHALGAVGAARRDIGEAGVGGEVVPADQPAEVRPVAVGLEEHELDVAAVLGPVHAHEGVHEGTAPAGGGRCVATERGEDVGGQRPHRGREQRHVDDRAPPGPLPLEQRGRHAEGEGHRAVAIPHRTPLVDRVVAVRRGQDVGQSPAGPEGRGVVAGPVGVGAPDAVAVTARVDEARVALGHRRGIEAQAPEGAGPQARQENVGRLEQPVQYGAAVVVLDVERKRLLARVGQRHRQVHALALAPDALRGQPAVGVATRGLDVDDVGTPVGEQCAGDRHEHPLGQLDDAHAREGLVLCVGHLIHLARPRAAPGSPWSLRCGGWRRRTRRSSAPCRRPAGPWRSR